MATYSKSDLRAADMFGLILVGAGLLFLVLGILTSGAVMVTSKTAGTGPKVMATSEAGGMEKVPAAKATPEAAENDKIARAASKAPARPTVKRLGWNPALVLLGVVFACLGGALNLGLRQVRARGGSDETDAAEGESDGRL